MDLYRTLDDTISLVTTLNEDCAKGLDWYSSWATWFDVFYSNFESLRSIIRLLETMSYADCFVILRKVFEYYFLLVLMVRGRKYKETLPYRIVPQGSSAKKDARDATFGKWMEEWKSGESGKTEHQTIIDIQKGKADDIIRITFHKEGPFDSKGNVTPRFVFSFEQYDPDVNFLADLRTVFSPYKRSSGTSEIVQNQRYLYRQFLTVRRILSNLKLNNLVTDDQADRFRVHYNFLSSFTHPTRRGAEGFTLRYTKAKLRKDQATEHVVMYYVAHFEAMLINEIVGYFVNKNPKADLSRYKFRASELEGLARDFWFIYNDPIAFDEGRSDDRKMLMRSRNLPIPTTTLYYDDPIDRMRQILSKGTCY